MHSLKKTGCCRLDLDGLIGYVLNGIFIVKGQAYEAEEILHIVYRSVDCSRLLRSDALSFGDISPSFNGWLHLGTKRRTGYRTSRDC